MVASKHVNGGAHNNSNNSNNNNNGYEIRSGMSVQDLKQLTAQRAQRQRMEYWDLQARNSPRQTNTTSGSERSYGSPSSSSSTHSSLSSDSPPRQQYSKNNIYAYPNNYQSHSHHHHHHHYHRHHSPSHSPSGPEKMFVTYGGQVVSFMEGVVNAPQFDFVPELLNTL